MKLLIASILLVTAPLTAYGVVVQAERRGCEAYAASWLKAPATKEEVVNKANAACLDHQDIKPSACMKYEKLIERAFHFKDTKDVFSSKDFCGIMEAYVEQMANAHKVPYMGKGKGLKFKLDKTCMVAAKKSMSPDDSLPAESAPNFWYALCMHQDCAHFIPSRSRFCKISHEPTHSASVCEALRTFVTVSIKGKDHTHTSHVKEDELCGMYEGFVEATHLELQAYKHIVHDASLTHKEHDFFHDAMSWNEKGAKKTIKSKTALAAVPSVAIALLAMAA